MKAARPSTCSLCGLSIQPGEEIQHHTGKRVYRRTSVNRQWAHMKCIKAWSHDIKPDELLECSLCGERIERRKLMDHWLFDHGMGKIAAYMLWRDLLYERLEASGE